MSGNARKVCILCTDPVLMTCHYALCVSVTHNVYISYVRVRLGMHICIVTTLVQHK